MSKLLPLTAAQKRLWLEWKNNPQSLAYNINFCYRLKGNLDVHRLSESINIVLCNKGITRLQIVEEEGVPYQVLHEKLLVSPKSEYINKLNHNCNDEDILNEIKRYTTPFDLLSNNLYRQLLIRVAKDEYILCMTFHHIILDGISGNMIINAISKQYSNILNYTKLSELTSQDIINWSQKDHINQSYKRSLEEYWEKRLRSVETSTKLLERDYKVKNFKACRQFFALDSALSKDLLSLIKKLGCTPFMLMSALFVTLLYRYTQKEKIALAYTVSNRQKIEQDMIGFHIDMLPLICDIQDDMLFSNLVDQIKCIRATEKKHQFFATPIITKILHSRKQVLPNIVINQSLSFVSCFHLPEVECTNFHINAIDPQCDLLLSFDIKDEIFAFEFEFNLEKYSEDFISGLTDSLYALIQDITYKEDTRVTGYNILSNTQKKNIIKISTGEEIKLPKCNNVYELIYNNAANEPDKIAVVSDKEQITFQELDARVNNYVQLINSLDNKSDIVGVCLERSIEQIITILAIVKSGRAYLPLDPEYPEDRLQYILTHSKAKILISNSANVRKFVRFTGEKIDISSATINQKSNKTQVAASKCCYVIYTSGSTGSPKGISISHQALFNRIDWMNRTYGLLKEQRILHKTPYSFDVSVWEIFWPLMYGGTMVLAAPLIHKDPIALSQCIERHKVDIIHFVPSMLAAFLQFKEVRRAKCLRQVFTSGEALNYSTIHDFIKLFPNTKFSNLYGPTEASIDVTFWNTDSDTESITPPIGKPIQNMQCLILDKDLNILPKGVCGDLYISGVGVTEGYLYSKELNLKAFVQNPYSKQIKEYAKMYKSGDKARFLPCGNIEYLGRFDDQVKIRGLRVELGEIDNSITKYAGVKNCCTVAINSKLVTFIEPNIETPNIDISKLKDYLCVNLPEFMIPVDFVILDELPLSPSGKIDRKHLVNNYIVTNIAERMTSQSTVSAVISRDNIIKTWSKVLNIPVANIHSESNFFALGGDSLQMLHMLAKLQSININVRPSDFLKNPVLSTLYSHTNIAKSENSQHIQENLQYNLTPIQYWFFANVHKDINLFYQYCTLSINGNIDPKDFEVRLSNFFAGYDIFNTYFLKHSNLWSWHKKDASSSNNAFKFINLIHQAKPDNDTLLKFASDYISIEDGLFCVVCLWRDGKKLKATLMIHHLVIDLLSWNTLLDELNETVVKDSKAINTEFLKWSNELSAYSRKIQNDIDLIHFYIDNANVLDRGKGAYKTTRVKLVSTSLSLRINNTAMNISIAALSSAICAFAEVMDINSVVVEHESHGRNDLNSNGLDVTKSIGWYTAKYPLTYNCSSRDIDLIYCRCHSISNAVKNNGVDFGILRYLSNYQIMTLFKEYYNPHISFNFLGEFNNVLQDKCMVHLDGQIAFYKSHKSNPMYPVDINCWIESGSLECRLEIYLNQEKAAQFIESFRRNFVQINRNDNISNLYIPTSLQQEIIAYTLSTDSLDQSYISTWKLEINDKIDESALRKACEVSIEKRDVLNSVLDRSNSHLVLKVSKRKLCFKEYDISKTYHRDKNALQKLVDAERSGISIEQEVIKLALVKLSDCLYVLIFYVHHAVIDGQSMYLLKRDIIENYLAITKNQHLLAKNPPSFLEYSNVVNSQSTSTALRFWKNFLQHAEPTKFLYKLINHANDQESFRFISKSYNLSTKVLEFLQQNSLTLSTAINGIVGLLISKHTMECEKIIWGNTLSMRLNEIKNDAEIVGPCITTVPMYFDFSKKVKLIDYLKEISIEVANALKYGNASLSEICTYLEKSSLFNFLFVYQNFVKVTEQLHSQFGSFRGEISSHFDCTYVCEVNDNQLYINSKFNLKYFDEEAISMFSDKLYQMLEGLISHQNTFLQEICILDKWEKTAFEEFNATNAKYDDQATLYQVVEQQIRNNNSNIAVLDSDGKSYTYKQLKKEVDKISAVLNNQLVSGRVGVLLSRSFKQIAAVLAVLRSKACLVGLDTSFPRAKLREICHSSNIELIITDHQYYDLIKRVSSKIVNLDKIDDTNNVSNQYLNTNLKREYFIAYTSGSTGKPKMVLTDEKSHLNRLLWLKDSHPMQSSDTGAYKTKLCFAPSIREILEPLIQGNTICVLSDEELSEPNRLLNRIKRDKISRIFFTPSHLMNLLNFENSRCYLDSIQHLEISGESFDETMLTSIQSILPNAKIYNRYGATEIASVIYTDLSKGYEQDNNKLVAGRPIYNSKALVVNNNLDLLPVGCIGEILLGGDSCALGYLGQDSSEVFIQKSNLCNNTKFFKTGDLGLLTKTNNLIVLGRKNKICKIRGFRINLLEIENAINKLSFIKHAAVIHSQKNNTIVAFVVPKKLDLNALNIQEYVALELEKQLPYYSLPSEIIVVEQIPKTNSGKINYVSLSHHTKYNQKSVVFKPQTKDESNVVSVLKEIVDYQSTADTSFFRLGLTSLTAQLFVYRLSAIYKFNIPVAMVYANPNIPSLAKKLEEQQKQVTYTPYITFNQEKEGRIIAFPPAGGSPLNYQELSSNLSKRVIAFHNLEKAYSSQSINAIAQEYVQRLHKNKLSDHCYLVGWSLGGTVAYEVACQLKQQNINPLGVFLIDPGFNVSTHNYYENNSESNLIEIMKRNLISVDDNIGIIEDMLSDLSAASKKINEYRPNKYTGDVVLIKPQEVAKDERNYGVKNNGLDQYVSGAIISYQVPGNHMTMMTNYSREIAKIFNNYYYGA